MGILKDFGTQAVRINISDNIRSGTAGVMGDFNSRSLKVSILSEEGEKLDDRSVKIKMLCKTEKDQLIFTEGEYSGEGTYTVDFPNEVFEMEQELECIIQLTKDDSIIYSQIFKRRVQRGLLGTEREGTSTIIDLLKIMDFADHYEEKLKEMEDLGNKEEADIIRKAKAETDKFNSNAKNKTDAVNKIKTEVEGYKNTTVKAKDITLANKADFDKNYNRVTGILDAETDREKAEAERKKHDKEIQDLINGGLDSAGFVKLEDLKETEKHFDDIRVGENLLEINPLINPVYETPPLYKTTEIELGTFKIPKFYKTDKGQQAFEKQVLSFGFIYQNKSLKGDWEFHLKGIGVKGNVYFDKKLNIYALGELASTWYRFSEELKYQMSSENYIKLIFEVTGNGLIRFNILNPKVELGNKPTPFSVSNFDLQSSINRLENDLIEQTEENNARFDAIDKALENANKINDNLILRTNREWNEGRQITKLTDFSFISPFLNGFNRFTETGELTPVTVSYKVKFTDITVVNPVSLYFRLREVTGDTYGGWKEAKDTFTPSISKEFYFKHTFELPQSYFEARNNFKFDFRLDGIPSGYIYIKELKLEYGYKATTWVPAQADIEESNRESLEVNKRLETKLDTVIKLIGEGNKNYMELLERDNSLIGG